MSGILTCAADLLEYPSVELAERCAELSKRLAEERPGAAQALEEFRKAIEPLPFARLEEIYTATFDVNPVCCLYVGYHLFGESYKRGAFMAKLNAAYGDHGFEPGAELPDHLPVVLRFLGALDDPEQRAWLLEEAVLPALAKVAKAFEGTDNVYGALMRSVLLALQPPGFVPAKDGARPLPVLEPVDDTPKEWDHG